MQITKRTWPQLEHQSTIGIIRSRSIAWGISHTSTSKRSSIRRQWCRWGDGHWVELWATLFPKHQPKASVKNSGDSYSTWYPYTGKITLRKDKRDTNLVRELVQRDSMRERERERGQNHKQINEYTVIAVPPGGKSCCNLTPSLLLKQEINTRLQRLPLRQHLSTPDLMLITHHFIWCIVLFIYILPICLSVFGQLQVAYWTTLKAGFDTELFASLLKAFLCWSHSPFSQWWTFGLVPQALFQLLSCSSDLQD